VYRRAQVLGFLQDTEGGTLAQAALRFCPSHPAVSTVIAGMRKWHHAVGNCRASDAGPLSEEHLARLKEHAWPHNFWH
jgi:aryl-alcohol dehydrogenase-like predicted oxidoreductase